MVMAFLLLPVTAEARHLCFLCFDPHPHPKFAVYPRLAWSLQFPASASWCWGSVLLRLRTPEREKEEHICILSLHSLILGSRATVCQVAVCRAQNIYGCQGRLRQEDWG